MVPLVRDLIDHGTTGQTQAIFLYPLNALMEDQKERLQKLLKDTELTFAVYNGDMPEDDKGDNKRKVNLIKGMMPKIDEHRCARLRPTSCSPTQRCSNISCSVAATLRLSIPI